MARFRAGVLTNELLDFKAIYNHADVVQDVSSGIWLGSTGFVLCTGLFGGLGSHLGLIGLGL